MTDLGFPVKSARLTVNVAGTTLPVGFSWVAMAESTNSELCVLPSFVKVIELG